MKTRSPPHQRLIITDNSFSRGNKNMSLLFTDMRPRKERKKAHGN